VKRVGINVYLGPELTKFVDDKVECGFYPTANEVVRAALEAMRERECAFRSLRDSMDRDIDVGLAELDAGDTVAADRFERELSARVCEAPKRRWVSRLMFWRSTRAATS